MDKSDVITLLKTTLTVDEYGVERRQTEGRDVYCQVDSVTRSEFFAPQGGRSGLNPEYRFRIFEGDYQKEVEVVYHGRTFSVYRTYYARNDVVELYVERKGGSNGAENRR